MGIGEVGHPRNEHTDWFPMPNGHLLKTCMQTILYELNKNGLYLGIYIHTNSYMHAMTIHEKRGHEFEGEQGGITEDLERGKLREKCCN